MNRIDIHTHILPKDIPNWKKKFGYGGFISLEHHKPCCAKMIRDDGVFFREIQDNCFDETVRLKECAKLGTSIQVLSTVPVLFNYWAKPKDTLTTSKYLNDHIAKICHEHPTRFLGLATLPMQDPKLAIQELERAKKELHLSGIQIGSHINEWNLNDDPVLDVFRAAQDLDACIFVHPWDMMGQDRMKKYWLPWLVGMPAEVSLAICSMIFGGVFEKFPKLRVAFAHGGGAFSGTLGRIEHGFQVRPDLCAVDNSVSPKESLGKFFVDSLVHDANTLKKIVDLFGSEQILLGSDYPFPLGEAHPGKMIAEHTEISAQTKENILFKNALRWLNKRENDFVWQ